ncbi:MAG: hypothetical protein WAL59_01300 [Roseiarcus sp.]
MTRKFIPGLIGAALVAGCLSAQAMPAGDTHLMHNYGVSGLAHEGNYVADFVQGRLITAAPRAAAFTMANADADRATRYASESAMLTIVFLAIVAVLAGLAVLGGIRRSAGRGEAAPKDGWKQTMFEILEADLTSLDSVTHGFAGR